MFDFLKKKLKEAIGSFTKKVEKEAAVVEEPEEESKQKPKKEAQVEKKEEKQKQTKKEEKKPTTEAKKTEKAQEKKEHKREEEKHEKKHHETKEIILPETHHAKEKLEEKPLETTKQHPAPILKEEKKGFFQKLFSKKEEKPTEEKPVLKEEEKPKTILEHISDSITKVSLSENKFEELFWDLEVSLLENNVAVEVVDKIKSDLRRELVDKKLQRGSLEAKIMEALKESVESLFDVKKIDLIKRIRSKKPFIIVMIGINGTGKTTTAAKLVNLFKKNHLECVVAACDTFRAAAIQQLEEHTNKLGVKLIKHDYGADPAAVAFDAIEHAKAKGKDVVLIDTAGRLHSNVNLMAELEKIIKVAKPDMKIFIGESIAGNDVVEQVKLFNEKIGIDGIILSKADVDEKGGAAISVSYITGKPIMYLGMGQRYEDLIEFDKEKIMGQIGL